MIKLGFRLQLLGYLADIEGGGKLLGKQGPWAMHVLATRADLSTTGSSAGYTVARVQRDVAARSSVGVLLANRTLDGRNQGSVGGDASLYFTENWGLTGQFVHSYGQYSEGADAFFVRPSYDSATAHFHVGYTHLGDRLADNVNVVGFIVDDDRREVDAGLNKTVWLPDGPVERVQYDSAYDAYWGQTGTLRSWQVDESIAVDFRSRWSTTARHTEEFKRFERDFRNRQTGVELGYQHPVLPVLPGRVDDRPQLRRGLRARERRRAVQAHRPDLDRVRAAAADPRSGPS